MVLSAGTARILLPALVVTPVRVSPSALALLVAWTMLENELGWPQTNGGL